MVKRFLKIKESATAIILEQLHNYNYMLSFSLLFSSKSVSKPKRSSGALLFCSH